MFLSGAATEKVGRASWLGLGGLNSCRVSITHSVRAGGLILFLPSFYITFTLHSIMTDSAQPDSVHAQFNSADADLVLISSE